MIKSALHSIKDDFSRSLFYWLAFVLTSMFMFLFFHLSLSDLVGVTFINSKNDMSTFITVLVIAICMVVIFFANDFYVKKKSKELAVRLVCGATYMQIASYLLIQTMSLFVLAIPFGILLALLLFPVINQGLYVLTGISHALNIQGGAIISTIVILVVEIFWCTILNLGYAYRSSIRALMTNNKIVLNLAFTPLSLNFKMTKNFKKWASLLLFFIPMILFYFIGEDSSNMLFLAILGIFGLFLGIDNFVIPTLNDFVQDRYADDHIKVAYLGFLRSDISMMKMNVILLITSAILLITILITSLDNPIEVMLSIISFIVINILLSLSVMFKFSTEIYDRKKVYASIERLGYMKDDQKKLIRKEILGLYGFIGGISLFYIINIFIVLMIYHDLNVYFVLGMVISFLIPLIICAMINMIYYQRMILKED